MKKLTQMLKVLIDWVRKHPSGPIVAFALLALEWGGKITDAVNWVHQHRHVIVDVPTDPYLRWVFWLFPIVLVVHASWSDQRRAKIEGTSRQRGIGEIEDLLRDCCRVIQVSTALAEMRTARDMLRMFEQRLDSQKKNPEQRRVNADRVESGGLPVQVSLDRIALMSGLEAATIPLRDVPIFLRDHHPRGQIAGDYLFNASDNEPYFAAEAENLALLRARADYLQTELEALRDQHAKEAQARLISAFRWSPKGRA